MTTFWKAFLNLITMLCKCTTNVRNKLFCIIQLRIKSSKMLTRALLSRARGKPRNQGSKTKGKRSKNLKVLFQPRRKKHRKRKQLRQKKPNLFFNKMFRTTSTNDKSNLITVQTPKTASYTTQTRSSDQMNS
jgi:hypothetical protein